MKVRGVLFDLDGTLVDHDGAVDAALRGWLPTLGVAPEPPGLADRVGPVWTVEDLGLAKPDPAAFRAGCARWGLPPGAVLSVGDRHDLDVRPGRRV